MCRSPRKRFTRGRAWAPSKRALWDATITDVLAGYYEPDAYGRKKPVSLYGSLKMWAHLEREGIPVARSTVERSAPPERGAHPCAGLTVISNSARADVAGRNLLTRGPFSLSHPRAGRVVA